MPAAARQGDSGLVHCSGYTIAAGSPNVRINGKPAARQGDSSTPHKKPGGKKCVIHTATISQGSSSVRVNGKPLARVGDSLSGCTRIASGSNNVRVG
jgi:uncharacterized Zn-binding protein involved in type VI secretion